MPEAKQGEPEHVRVGFTNHFTTSVPYWSSKVADGAAAQKWDYLPFRYAPLQIIPFLTAT
jgi:hypothetical protein